MDHNKQIKLNQYNEHVLITLKNKYYSIVHFIF